MKINYFFKKQFADLSFLDVEKWKFETLYKDLNLDKKTSYNF